MKREEDAACRYGGEEFLMILPDAGTRESVAMAERIRTAVADCADWSGQLPIRITVSAGAASSPDHGVTPDEILNIADKALYEAKRRGRNQVVAADAIAGGTGEKGWSDP